MNILSLFLLLLGSLQASHWNVQTSGVQSSLRGISAMSDAGRSGSIIWASGSAGVILKSADSGKTWKQLHVEGGDKLDFRGIRAVDGQTAYVMSSGDGENSRIYKTTDGGESWSQQYTDKRPKFFLDGLVCFSATHCVALSDPVDGKFVIVGTQNGKDWKELPRDHMPGALPNEGAFAASNSVLTAYGSKDLYLASGGASAARVFHSVDAGLTWTVSETPILAGDPACGIFSITRAENTIVIVGGNYTKATLIDRVAAYSSDQGATWHLASRTTGGYRSAVASLGGSSFIAAGPSGADISTDGGKTWSPTDSLNLNALAVSVTRRVWGAGSKGTVAILEPSPK
jgi:photosystem II stability/assembly factor-like uncharacterized protein